MEYRNLGRTGVKVSPLCLGTMNFPYRAPEDEAIRIIHRAIDEGINFIDTANFYGQPLNDGKGQGLSEELLGRALKGKREPLVLATKVFAQTAAYPEDPNARGLSRRHIIAECEASLRRLDTDYIDLYQMHRPDPAVPIDETLRAFDDLIRTGKVRYIGSSAFAGWQLVQSIWEAKRHGLNRIVTEQPRYNLLMRAIEKEVVPAALVYEIALLPYSPLAGGILSGKYRRGDDFPSDSRMVDAAWSDWAQSFLSERVWQAMDVLNELAEEKKCTLSQLALAWLKDQPGVSSVIIGPRTLDHLLDNLGALELEIGEQEQARIDEITIPGGNMHEA